LKEKCLYIQVFWTPLKARYLQITTAVRVPLESQVDYLYITVAIGPLWKQGTFYITVAKGARGKRLACLLLNTPLYITLTMILHENMKPIEHVLLHPIHIGLLSHLMCACKTLYSIVKLSLYYWTHWSCRWVYHFKKKISRDFSW